MKATNTIVEINYHNTTSLYRIFWVGVFFICIWFTIHMLWLAVNEYKLNPTNNSIHDDVPINRGPFPGVTVAATNTFRTSGIDNAIK